MTQSALTPIAHIQELRNNKSSNITLRGLNFPPTAWNWQKSVSTSIFFMVCVSYFPSLLISQAFYRLSRAPLSLRGRCIHYSAGVSILPGLPKQIHSFSLYLGGGYANKQKHSWCWNIVQETMFVLPPRRRGAAPPDSHTLPTEKTLTVYKAARWQELAAALFIALVIHGPVYNEWLSNSNAWWESGSSSLRHKRRKCPQNHITLPFFFFLNCNISLSGEDALLSLVCLLSSRFCFMSFPVSSPLSSRFL